jgi:hypothetical protein
VFTPHAQSTFQTASKSFNGGGMAIGWDQPSKILLFLTFSNCQTKAIAL